MDNSLRNFSPRLSVSESEEWVCTKTVFPNASILRACEKTYTGIDIIPVSLFAKIPVIAFSNIMQNHQSSQPVSSGGERFSSCFFSSSPTTPLRCLCSSEFCNTAPLFSFPLFIYILVFVETFLHITVTLQ